MTATRPRTHVEMKSLLTMTSALQPSCILFTNRKWFLQVVNIYFSGNELLCEPSKITLCFVWDITKSRSTFQKFQAATQPMLLVPPNLHTPNDPHLELPHWQGLCTGGQTADNSVRTPDGGALAYLR